ncbi:MAG: DUF2855 family protein [Acidimicrobiales bacterium]
MVDLEVRTDDLHRIRPVERPIGEPADGQAVLSIDTFGLSTNNVTFGVTGDLLGYWKLFPASEPGWGRVPVFGFAEVVASRHPGVAEGERLFGYLPMSEHLVVEPVRADDRGFLDGVAHRRDVMATVWNHYQRVEPASERADAVRSLLRPLFITGFLIEDFLHDHAGFGADVVVITSASAKTAIATAHEVTARGERRVVGLTSPGHVEAVRSLGAYDEVLPYDQAGAVAGDRAVLIDIAGRLDARDAVHERFGDGLGHSMTVGLSNVPEPERLLAPPPAHGPVPEVFYAQLQIAKRAGEWGQDAFDRVLDDAWERFVAFTAPWLAIERIDGVEAAMGAWRRLVAGDLDPTTGLQLSLRRR